MSVERKGIFLSAYSYVAILAVVFMCGRSAGGTTSAADNASLLVADVVKQAGRTGGLVVLLDNGDTALADAFAKRPGFLLQTLAATEARTLQLRKHLGAQSNDSRATAMTYPLGSLPYADGIVSLFVAETFGPDRGIGVEDLVRCLSPNGKAFLHISKQHEAWLMGQWPANEAELKSTLIEGQSWTVVTKKRPAGMDEWPQYRHDSARSRTSEDQLVAPPVHLRWIDGQRRSRSHKDHPNGAVSAGGRNFMLTDEGPRFYVAPAQPVLICRDAYNGLVLWRRELPIVKKATQDLNRTFSQAAMCATADRLYCALEPGGQLHALDALNGKTVTVFEHNPKTVLLVGDRLVLTGGGPVRAIDRSSGKTIWTSKQTSDNVVAQDGFVYAYLEGGEIVCLRMTDGKKMWQQKYKALSDPKLMDIRLRTVIDGVLICGTAKGTAIIYGMNAKDGAYLWGRPFTMVAHGDAYLDFFRLDGQIWLRGEQKADPKAVGKMIGRKTKDPNWSGLDPRTGKTVRTFPAKGYPKGCAPDTATAGYLICGKNTFFDFRTGEKTDIRSGRSVCGHGWMPANGMLYTFPTDCRCHPYLRGDMAMAPASTKDPTSMNPKAGRLTKGPAYGVKLKALAPAKEDWPIYRGTAERAGYVVTQVPAKPKVAWQRKVGGRLTSPVIADGKVVVSAVESHTIHAFDSRSGKPLWTFVAGNRVDQSPTYARGRFVFGCRDGSVYCLNAADGQLVWRYQAAPADPLIVAYGRVESARPILGSVLVENDEVYATAGRHTGMDGGILLARLNLDTGATTAQAPMDSRTASMNNMIVKHGEHLVMGNHTISIAELKHVYPGKPALSSGASSNFEDDTYAFRTYWTKSLGTRPEGVFGGDIIGHLLCFNDKFIYGADSYNNKESHKGNKHNMNKAGQGEYNLFAKPNISDVELRRSATTGWRVPVNMRVRALVLTEGTLFAAGNADPLDPQGTGDAQSGPVDAGLLQGFSTQDGSMTFTHALPSPPLFDGLAAARGALYLCTVDGTLLCLSAE
ncbi:MAG: PQQ-binding-like beta-propeller repeat protein [Verrucomicrobia bacterium]|jgi:outer membrane protein assembly factor BamB|nr:PQQ-binding-like beta-propeller repeat protein [Verrucomicrobiota bacterium]MBT7701076.1 PQQ-binding-like beta-propeller repeat protein [Verrucomicrobiota bacterium]